MHEILTAARYVVFGVVTLSTLVALGSWLVRTRRVSPFGAPGRGLRSATDWVLGPIERRLLRMGGNPAHAGWWLVVLMAVAGVVFLSLFGWLIRTSGTVQWAAAQGPRAVLWLAITLAYNVLVLALLARVIASWFGFFRYSRWMRPAYFLTDWLVEPLRRILPAFGPFDVSPLAAWLVLWVLKQVLRSVVL